jgi:hypothetical protein
VFRLADGEPDEGAALIIVGQPLSDKSSDRGDESGHTNEGNKLPARPLCRPRGLSKYGFSRRSFARPAHARCSDRADRRDKSIAMSWNRPNELWAIRVVAEHATNRGDVLRKRVVPDDDLAPDGTRELVLVDDTPGTLEQRDECVRGLGRKDDELAALIEAAQLSVESVWPEVVIDRRSSGKICRHRAERIAVAVTSASLYCERHQRNLLPLLMRCAAPGIRFRGAPLRSLGQRAHKQALKARLPQGGLHAESLCHAIPDGTAASVLITRLLRDGDDIDGIRPVRILRYAVMLHDVNRRSRPTKLNQRMVICAGRDV